MKNRIANIGCLVVVAFFIIYLTLLIRWSIEQNRARYEAEAQQRRLETIADVKAGEVNVSISDAELVEMLVNEPKCIENVSSIYFFGADLHDPRFERIREFLNLRELFFYSCDNVEKVLVRSHELMKVESIGFETTSLSEEIVEQLVGFQNLKKLRFEQVMPDETVAELRDRLPNVEIVAPYLASHESMN